MLTLPRILIISFAVLLLTTCESSTLYNKTPEQYLTNIVEVSDEKVGVDLSIIEFDEFGMMWDRKQLDAALSLIKKSNTESETGILLMTYIHGWNNNADPKNDKGDLALFRESVQALSKKMSASKKTVPKRIVAVYFGWRGISSNLPVLQSMTFWARKRVARRVASHHMREALISMSKATKENPISKVVMTGHSMGGMILSQTVSPSLSGALMVSGTKGIKFMVDLFVLKNPAVDALSTSLLINYFKNNGVVAENRTDDGSVELAKGPVIVSITSEADWVTKFAYPMGKIVGNIITATDFRTDKKRNFPKQETLANNTVGHIDFYTSHRAWVENGEVVLERIPNAYNDTPFWVIQVSKEISSGHSDVENKRFNDLTKLLLDKNHLFDTNAQTWLRKTK